MANRIDILHADETLNVDDTLTSTDGRFFLVMQADGNLVLYKHGQAGAKWASGSNGNVPCQAIMQGDGNFVLYDKDHGVVWASDSDGFPGAFVAVQSDGNMVVYSPLHQVLFASDTDEHPDPPPPETSPWCIEIFQTFQGHNELIHRETFEAHNEAECISRCFELKAEYGGDGFTRRQGSCDGGGDGD